MVRPAMIIGAIPLAAIASALYIPHADEGSDILDVATPPEAVAAYAVQHLKPADDIKAKRSSAKRSSAKRSSAKRALAKDDKPVKHAKHGKIGHGRKPAKDFESDDESDFEEFEIDVKVRKHGRHFESDESDFEDEHVMDVPKPRKHGKHGRFESDESDFEDEHVKDVPRKHGKHDKHAEDVDSKDVPRKHGKHDKHAKDEHAKGAPKHGKHAKEASRELPTGVVSFADPEKIVKDSYIVVLKEDAAPEALASTLQLLAEKSGLQYASFRESGEHVDHALMQDESAAGFRVRHVHDIDGKAAFRGFSGEFFPEVAEALAQSPDVQFIEKDSLVHILKPKEEDEAPWGLARVSHRDALGLSTYNKYLYEGAAGAGVTAYVVDTGIYTEHEDFGGRARWGKTMPVGDTDTDAHGHGSHCAGTIAGTKYGIAKKAEVVAVKVLGSDGSGTMSDVIGGVEYVVESHRREQKEKGSKLKGSTANMSLGGGKSPSLDLAVTAATNAGVHFAVAAGNENQNACNVSPASSEGAVTVGATNVRDERAYFSNWGKCVDIFAPGVNVLSVGTYSPSSTAVMSGTSMASPHIAGLLTYFVSLQPATDSEYATRGALTTKELKQHLIDYGTSDLLSDLDSDSPNVLAFQGGGGDLSKFWTGDDEHEKPKKPKSFFDKVEDAIGSAVDYVEDLMENQEVIDLI